MWKLGLVPGGVPATSGGEFEVAFADADGEHRLEWGDAWRVPFEACLPVRRFPSYKGQRHHVGRWWTATTFTGRVRVVVGARPADPAGLRSAGGRHRLATAWLFWTTPEGKAQSHAPDYFARLADGSGYRHPRHDLPEVAAALRAVLAEPPGLVDGAEAVGNPIAVQPVLFHLLWRCELDVELSVPLHPEAVVSR